MKHLISFFMVMCVMLNMNIFAEANSDYATIIPKNIGNAVNEKSRAVTFVDHAYFGVITGILPKGPMNAEHWFVDDKNIDPKVFSNRWIFSTDLESGQPSTAGGLVFDFSYYNEFNRTYRKTLSLKTLDGVQLEPRPNKTIGTPAGKHYLIKVSDGSRLYLNIDDFFLKIYEIYPNGYVGDLTSGLRLYDLIKDDPDINQSWPSIGTRVFVNKSSVDIAYRHHYNQPFNHLIRITFDVYTGDFVIKKVF